MNLYPELATTGLKMFTTLGIVLAGLIAVSYLMKRILRKNIVFSGSRLIRVLESNYLGTKKRISVIDVGGKILVVGITNDNITLLTSIEKQALERVQEMKEEKVPLSFPEWLQKISTKARNHVQAKEG